MRHVLEDVPLSSVTHCSHSATGTHLGNRREVRVRMPAGTAIAQISPFNYRLESRGIATIHDSSEVIRGIPVQSRRHQLGGDDMATTIDVPAWIEQQRVSRTQTLVMVLMTFTTAVDGFDAQMIGYVAPAVIGQFKVPLHEFTSVFAIGLTGLLVGCLVIAPLGDWIGRKRVLLGSCIFFGVMSLLSAWTDSLQTLIILRFLTGLGLGGSMPNAIALTAEYFPSRNRAFATMAMFSGFPLGATLGGFLEAVAESTVTRYWETCRL